VERTGRAAKGGEAVIGEEAEPLEIFVDALMVKRKRLGIFDLTKSVKAQPQGHWTPTAVGHGQARPGRGSTNQIDESLRVCHQP